MSTIKRFALPSAAACIALFAFLASTTSAYALALPGITPSGVPVFINSVKVRLNSNGKLRIFTNGQGKDFSLYDGNSFRSGTGIFDLRTNVDDNGNIFGGTIQIKGKGAELGVPGSEQILLMTADLVNANLTTAPGLWGFNTTNIWCAPELNLPGGCTNSESVYITLNTLFTTADFSGKFTSSGTAFTTVPVPAAAWLFGSALGLLGWVRRRANATA